MKTLHLVLKRQWFDMIESEDKKEEYRVPTNYILPRVLKMVRPLEMERFGIKYDKLREAYWYSFGFKGSQDKAIEFLLSMCAEWRVYDLVKFQHGYKPDSRTVTFKFESISIGEGRNEWGAEVGKKYIVIKIGEKIETSENI